MNRIELKFNDDTCVLCGVINGREIYNKQIKDKIDANKKNVIVISENIKAISISFIRGMTDEIFKEYGYFRGRNMIQFIASDKIVWKINTIINTI
ncbi:MAG: hypothetical protein ACRC1T_09695 [Clostridium chrysemydis]|uniref:hypothetical protein n=1 Tax=Clostridium chrysemydis TaxID=2665504 RepID=UPI003F32211F